MSDLNLHFPSTSRSEKAFHMMELPPELLAIVEDGIKNRRPSVLTIRGRSTDEAVLCTPDKTYGIRSVALSNSTYVVTGLQEGETGNAIVRDCLQEVLELVPTVPKLQRLDGLLKVSEYDENMEQEDEEAGESKKRLHTYEDILSEVQASDAELRRGLKEKHILTLNGHLRPISKSYLASVLELLITTLVSLSQSPASASAADLADALESDHEVRREVSFQIMSWYGDLSYNGNCRDREAKWAVNVDALVREMGLNLLRNSKDSSISYDDFLKKWRGIVGDAFEPAVNITLLSGNYLTDPMTLHSDTRAITFFPSSELPIAPADRLADLFLTRPRWSADDITPFLDDCVTDAKERDRILMKYARVTTDADGKIWYTAKGGMTT